MKELRFEGPRTARWSESAVPRLTSDDGALVRPVVVSTCDMDAIAMGGMIRFRAGTPLGHEGIGEVIDVGDRVHGLRPGDRVIMPWQISCGACKRCRRGQDSHCESVESGACYGWGPHVERWRGFLADSVEVPYADHMLVALPDGLDPLVASGLGDNIVDAWRAVAPPLAETGGGRVLVVGGLLPDGGSIGLYAAAFAVSQGADEVVFVSPDAGLREQATAYGARALDIGELDGALDDLGSFDVTVDTSGSADGLALALRSCGPASVCTCTAGAVHRGAPPALPVYEMYMNTVTFKTGWVHTRALIDGPLGALGAGAFDPTVIADVHSFDDAEAAFDEPFTKLIFQRDAP